MTRCDCGERLHVRILSEGGRLVCWGCYNSLVGKPGLRAETMHQSRPAKARCGECGRE